MRARARLRAALAGRISSEVLRRKTTSRGGWLARVCIWKGTVTDWPTLICTTACSGVIFGVGALGPAATAAALGRMEWTAAAAGASLTAVVAVGDSERGWKRAMAWSPRNTKVGFALESAWAPSTVGTAEGATLENW